MEKNLNKVRDSRNAKRYWFIHTNSKDAVELIKRIFADEIAATYDGYGSCGYGREYSLAMHTPAWRRYEIVDILGLKRIKEIRNNRGWYLDL